ncbi:glycosyl transferase group 1 [Thalassoporum mexicanum PCC 7367]|nr:glycosyl transferase group 1 [Pseudanabaena sp. PCC 7367]
MGGAVERNWFNLGQEFVRQGHQVTHISRAYGDLPDTEKIAGVIHKRVKGFNTPKSLLVLKLYDLVYSWRVINAGVLPEADILVTNTFWLPILIRHQRFGAVYIHVGRYPKGQMRFYRHVARLQTVTSPVVAAIAQEIPDLRAKISLVPYPIAAAFYAKQANLDQTNQIEHPEEMANGDRVPEQPNSINANKQAKTILYVGRVHPEKGIELLLAAFQKLVKSGIAPNWQLTIVGPWETKYGGGGEDYLQKLQTMSNAISDRLNWVGAVFDQAQLINYYRSADLFVYPSLAEKGETFGCAPLEAMASGCPALVSGLECFQDFISEGESGFIFDHRSADPVTSLADQLKIIISDQQKLAAIAQTSYQAAQAYALPQVAKQYLADFEAVLKESAVDHH